MAQRGSIGITRKEKMGNTLSRRQHSPIVMAPWTSSALLSRSRREHKRSGWQHYRRHFSSVLSTSLPLPTAEEFQGKLRESKKSDRFYHLLRNVSLPFLNHVGAQYNELSAARRRGLSTIFPDRGSYYVKVEIDCDSEIRDSSGDSYAREETLAQGFYHHKFLPKHLLTTRLVSRLLNLEETG
ncbi:hypothetical protein EVAR_69527_1 [Eumeta japonica]|uniref:Uncharacterized protein n=1 Tax=Eumeta variegata TaxID=151549 RepID=A0A4C1TDX1_EUMVA|nr:hypothetical protein EVAR_69527_1 [Eumeta japonica]